MSSVRVTEAGARRLPTTVPGAFQRYRRLFLSVGSAVVVLTAWELAGFQSEAVTDLISRPSEIARAAVRMAAEGELGHNALVSATELVLGFIPAVLVGVALGLGMAISRVVRQLLEPLVIGLYTTPYVTLIPLLIVWFGVGKGSKVAIVFLAAMFPIAINTLAAAGQVDQVLTRVVRSFGGGRFDVVRHVVVPSALPGIITGMQLGIGRGLVGIIVGEMYVSIAGLGNVLRLYSSVARVTEIFVIVACFCLVGISSAMLLGWVEERVGRWRRGR